MSNDNFFKYSKEYREQQRTQQYDAAYAMWRFMKWLEGGMTYEQIDAAVNDGALIPDFNRI